MQLYETFPELSIAFGEIQVTFGCVEMSVNTTTSLGQERTGGSISVKNEYNSAETLNVNRCHMIYL